MRTLDPVDPLDPGSLDSLESLGFGPFFAAQRALLDRPDLVPARIAGEGPGCYQLLGCRSRLGELSGRLRHDLSGPERPAVGDWVAVADGGPSDRAIVHHVFDRRTAMVRRAAGTGDRPQIVAANADAFLIVTSANRDLNPRRVERYLSAVLDSGAEPVLVLNKIDLAPDGVAAMVSVLEAVAQGATVVPVSAATGENIGALDVQLGRGRTAGLVGSSGVGKSSLVNRILGHELQPAAPVGDDGRGRHTTTRRELIAIPGGGLLVDTPGMRELGLFDDDGGLAASFADIAGLAGSCRFRDCAHQGEPHCAVEAAVASGQLDPARLASYRKLLRELAAIERRTDPVARARHRQHWKAVHASLRQRARTDPKLRS